MPASAAWLNRAIQQPAAPPVMGTPTFDPRNPAANPAAKRAQEIMYQRGGNANNATNEELEEWLRLHEEMNGKK